MMATNEQNRRSDIEAPFTKHVPVSLANVEEMKGQSRARVTETHRASIGEQHPVYLGLLTDPLWPAT